MFHGLAGLPFSANDPGRVPGLRACGRLSRGRRQRCRTSWRDSSSASTILLRRVLLCSRSDLPQPFRYLMAIIHRRAHGRFGQRAYLWRSARPAASFIPKVERCCRMRGVSRRSSSVSSGQAVLPARSLTKSTVTAGSHLHSAWRTSFNARRFVRFPNGSVFNQRANTFEGLADLILR